MRFTQRTVTLGTFIFILIVTLTLLTVQLVDSGFTVAIGFVLTGIALVLELVLLLAYRNGWEPARYVFLVFLTFASGLTAPPDGSYSFALLSAPAFAVIMGTPAWILGTAVVGYVLALGQTGMNGPYADITNVLLFSIPIGAIVLGRLVTETALRDAQASAQRAEAAGRHTEAQSAQLAEANRQMAGQIEEQRRLLNLVSDLEVPAMTLADGLLFAPIVGNLDHNRVQRITAGLLGAVHTRRARRVVLDISGVPTMDAAVSQALVGTIRALRLLGCEVVLSGIGVSTATTLAQLGVDLGNVPIVQSPQEALEWVQR